MKIHNATESAGPKVILLKRWRHHECLRIIAFPINACFPVDEKRLSEFRFEKGPFDIGKFPIRLGKEDGRGSEWRCHEALAEEMDSNSSVKLLSHWKTCDGARRLLTTRLIRERTLWKHLESIQTDGKAAKTSVSWSGNDRWLIQFLFSFSEIGPYLLSHFQFVLSVISLCFSFLPWNLNLSILSWLVLNLLRRIRQVLCFKGPFVSWKSSRARKKGYRWWPIDFKCRFRRRELSVHSAVILSVEFPIFFFFF